MHGEKVRRKLQLRNRDGQEPAEAAAIRRLAELQQEAKLLDRPLAAIDLRLPDRLVVRTNREAPESQPARPVARRERG